MNDSARCLLPLMLTALLVPAIAASAEGNGTPSSPLELWHDRAVFSPRFFPEADSLSAEDIFVAGLEARFPNRVFREEPGGAPGPAEPPLVESLLPGVTYVRVHHLETALARIRDALAANSLVLDLRNVEAERDSALALGAILAINETVKISVTEQAAANESAATDRTFPIEAEGLRRPLQPVFVLTNQATAGPLEALLAELKDKGQIISIGTATAGRTGLFRRIDTTPPLHVLNGEWRPASGESLLEDGFIPSVLMRVPPEEDRKAYRALAEGKSLRTLVAADPAEDDREETDDLHNLLTRDPPEAPAEQTIDAILQRAYFIATALQSMGKIATPERD